MSPRSRPLATRSRATLGALDTATNNAQISTIPRGLLSRGLDHLWPSRRQQHLASLTRERPKERLRPMPVELARDVVEEEQRLDPPDLSNDRDLAESERDDDATLLPLRRDATDNAPPELDLQVVSVRSDGG